MIFYDYSPFAIEWWSLPVVTEHSVTIRLILCNREQNFFFGKKFVKTDHKYVIFWDCCLLLLLTQLRSIILLGEHVIAIFL